MIQNNLLKNIFKNLINKAIFRKFERFLLFGTIPNKIFF